MAQHDQTLSSATSPALSWLGIIRLGLVQAALGAMVVLATTTLNRVMVVELSLAALLPGVLVGLHYAFQISRPVMGLRVDTLGRASPLVITGVGILALSTSVAAIAIPLLAWSFSLGLALSVLAYFGIGLGVSAGGTALLALMAREVSPARRPAAATITWTLMIVGIIISASVAGSFLDPYSPTRLIMVVAAISGSAFLLACLALWRVEHAATSLPTVDIASPSAEDEEPGAMATIQILLDTFFEPQVRRYAIFVFVSMLAYSAQDLILEPYAGIVFGASVGESTKLAATQHQGVLAGMILVGLIGSLKPVRRYVPMVAWTLIGCTISALALLMLATASGWAHAADLPLLVILLGFGNGIFAVGAIGGMFSLAHDGKERREGTRVGIWGAAQAFAFALGGVVATLSVDLIRIAGGSSQAAYGSVFMVEALLFLISAALALTILKPARDGESSFQNFEQGIAAMEDLDGPPTASPHPATSPATSEVHL